MSLHPQFNWGLITAMAASKSRLVRRHDYKLLTTLFEVDLSSYSFC